MNIILLRGLMREARHWGDFPKQLENSNGIGRVVCLDFPGIGTEEKRFFTPVLKEVVRDVRSRFQHREHSHLNEDWAILGFSLGGMVSLEWVKMYPNDFKKIILLNTSASNSGRLWQRLKPESMPKVVKIFLEEDPLKRETQVIEMISNLRKKDAKLIQEWAHIAKTSQFSKITAINQLIAATQFKVPESLTIPSLVLTSRADRMVNYSNSLFIAQRLGSDLCVHPTAGHDLTVDDSDWCLSQITSWL